MGARRRVRETWTDELWGIGYKKYPLLMQRHLSREFRLAGMAVIRSEHLPPNTIIASADVYDALKAYSHNLPCDTILTQPAPQEEK